MKRHPTMATRAVPARLVTVATENSAMRAHASRRLKWRSFGTLTLHRCAMRVVTLVVLGTCSLAKQSKGACIVLEVVNQGSSTQTARSRVECHSTMHAQTGLACTLAQLSCHVNTVHCLYAVTTAAARLGTLTMRPDSVWTQMGVRMSLASRV